MELVSGVSGLDKKILPKGWRWAKLWEVCQRPITTCDPTRRPDVEFTYVDISSVDNQRKCIVEPRSLLGRNAPSRARQVIKAGDIILATTRPNLNAVVLVPKELDNQICSTGFCVLRPVPELLSGEFLFFWVQHPDFVECLSDLVKGALYPAVTDNQVLAQYILLPPLSKQQRIAALLKQQLAAADRARKASEARLAAARALPAAYLREVFESEEISAWKRIKLGDFVASNIRTGISRPESRDSAIHCLTLSAIRDGKVLIGNSKPVSVTAREAKGNHVKPGAFYVVRGNGNRQLVGRGGIAPNGGEEVLFPDLLFEIVTNQSVIDVRFLRWVWDSDYVRTQIESKSRTAAGIYKINQRDLSSIEVPVPSPDKQKHIIGVLAGREAGLKALSEMIASELESVSALSQKLRTYALTSRLLLWW